MDLQNPAFPNLKKYCNHIHYRAIQSYGTRNSKKNLLETTVHINFILAGLFGIHLLLHADINLFVISRYISRLLVDCVRYKDGISLNRSSVPYILL